MKNRLNHKPKEILKNKPEPSLDSEFTKTNHHRSGEFNNYSKNPYDLSFLFFYFFLEVIQNNKI
jgi:hypothetical protein